MKTGLCPPEALYAVTPGATIQSIAAIYAHAVITEDDYVHRRFGLGVPLNQTRAWTAKLSFPPQVPLDAAWAEGYPTDIAAFREYASTVYGAADACLSSVSDADLARPVTKHMVSLREGRPVVEQALVPLGFDFADMVTMHSIEHAGEISAILGLRGMKGSPWG